MREWWAKLRGAPKDLDEEVRGNLDLAIEENLARGMSPEDARSASLRHFGNLTLAKEQAREAWTFPPLDTFLQDVRYGLRGIRRAKAFSLLLMLTLALGIGATTAIFSVVYSALLLPLPYPAGERLVWLGESTHKALGISITWINYQHLRAENHSFEDMAMYQTAQLTLTGRGDPVLTRAGVVTADFFPLLGMRPVLGRVFADTEDRLGAEPAVVLGHEFWAAKLGGDPKIVGATLDLNGKSYEVIGVLAASNRFFGKPVDFYLPLGLSQRPVTRAQHGSMRALARLKPGVTLDAARADLNGIMQRLAQADPGPETDHTIYCNSLANENTKGSRPTLLILMGAAGLVLLIACANVASLLLARGATRTGEIAIRAAIGAGRLRIVRQLLTESLLIACIGGAAGVQLARWSLKLLLALRPPGIPRLAETGLHGEVLLFAAGVTLLTGVVVGIAPVFFVSRFDLTDSLKDNSRWMTRSVGGQAFRSALVVVEIAIALVLCFGSSLLIRSLVVAQTTYPGFEAGHLLAMELVLPSSSYKEPQAIGNFHERLVADLRVLPGVTDVGAVYCPPSGGDCGDYFYSVLGQPQPARGEVPLSLFNSADPDYFRTMRIPIRDGRTFAKTDRRSAPMVAIVNEELARRWWPKQSAVGQRIKVGGPYMDGPILEIVGVAANVSQMGLDTTAWPEIYQPSAQSLMPSNVMVVMLRSTGDPGVLANAVRRRVFAIDRNLPIQSLHPFEQSLAATLDRRRFITTLLAVFAGLAMLLAAVGIYGLLNYWVRIREPDIAIRMTLGAERGAIMRWVTGHVLRLAGAGVILGALGGWMALGWMRSLVFGISAQNPATMIAAVAVIIGIALLASVLPAWRAAQVDMAQKLHRA